MFIFSILGKAIAEFEGPDDAPLINMGNADCLNEEQQQVLDTSSESHEFQAEVNRLMDIIINSLYGKKEVFLRELVSNAADALEKMRFISIENDEELGTTKDLHVVVEYDSDAKTVTVADTGVGMTKQDLINNLGTIAKSGTTNFLEALATGGGDVNLIGQFGVGFYSAFLVADKVTVTSKNNADDQHIWQSTADAQFSVVKDPRGPTLGRGTRITLHLKEDATEYMNKDVLTDLLTKYSQFINFPIYVRAEKIIQEPVDDEDEEETTDKKSDDDEVEVGEEEKEKPEKSQKFVDKKVHELKKLNIMKPIWMRSKDEISEEEYSSFYKSLVRNENSAEPLMHTHFNAEGEIEFKALLFVPPEIGSDPYDMYFNKKHDIKLYVRRVLVSEQFEDIIPKWLSFVKGVVDSDDLPLKVDRDSVSQSKIIEVMCKRITRKLIDSFRKIVVEGDKADDELAQIDEAVRADGRIKANEDESDETTEELEYNEDEKKKINEWEAAKTKLSSFWKNFGKNIKLGCIDNEGDGFSNRKKIAKLLRYTTTKSQYEPISLETYVARMPESQTSIYYLTGESNDAMLSGPLIQGFIKKEIEVLLLSDAVDPACLDQLGEFDGKKLVSIEKGNVQIDQNDEEKAYFEKLKAYYKPLTTWWKKHMSTKKLSLNKVVISTRLVTDPVAITVGQFGSTAFTEKIRRYQTFADVDKFNAGRFNKSLEINGQHPIIRKMHALHAEDETNVELMKYAEDLVQYAEIASGFPIEDPSTIANVLYGAVSHGIQADVPEDGKPLDDIDLTNFEVDEAEVKAAAAEENLPDFGDISSFLNTADMKMPEEADLSDVDVTPLDEPEDEDDKTALKVEDAAVDSEKDVKDEL